MSVARTTQRFCANTADMHCGTEPQRHNKRKLNRARSTVHEDIVKSKANCQVHLNLLSRILEIDDSG